MGVRDDDGMASGRSRWRGGLVAVAVLTILGAWLVPSPGDRGMLHDGTRDLAAALAVGAAIALALTAAVGTLVFLVQGGPGGGRAWFQAVSSRLAVGVSLMLVVVGAVAWQATLPRHGGHGGSSEAEHSARTAAARRWSTELTPVVAELRRPWVRARAFDARVMGARNSPAVRRAAIHERRQLAAVLRRMRGLPASPLVRLRRALHSFKRVVALRVKAFDLYRQALRRNGHRGVRVALDHYDRRVLMRANALSHRARVLGLALGPRLYGLGRLFSGA